MTDQGTPSSQTAATAAFRAGAALVATDTFGIFSLVGKDAPAFLHRQLSNEIRHLEGGQGAPTCFLNREGRILLYFTLWRTGEGYQAILAGKQKADFFPLLDRVLFSEDVKIVDHTSGLAFFLLSGPMAGEVLGAVLDGGKPETLQSLNVVFHDSTVNLYALDWLEVPTFLLAAPKEAAADLQKALLDAGAADSSLDGFHVLRIEKGTVWPEFEVDDSMIPFECGLAEAASLTKGCYVGQEIIARLHNLGKPPRLLRGLVLEGAEVPPIGTPVLHETTEVGKILSSAYSDQLNRPIATSSIRRKFSEEGTVLHVGGAKAAVRGFPLGLSGDSG
jgi:folate-binding protein YgfZ